MRRGARSARLSRIRAVCWIAFAVYSTTKRNPALAYEMVDGVESDQAYQDEVDGDDVAQQPRHDQDQDAGDKGDEWRDVSDGDNHFKSPQRSGPQRAFMHGH
jgi:hypothetical protein